MANEIKYQINGQLADNTVTVDNKEDMILVPVSIGSADENRIIAELKAEDSGLREETIRHVFDLQKRVIKHMLMTGMSVNTGLYYASVAFRGVIENSTWNPAKNSIVVNFNVGADLREAIKATTVGIIGEKGSVHRRRAGCLHPCTGCFSHGRTRLHPHRRQAESSGNRPVSGYHPEKQFRKGNQSSRRPLGDKRSLETDVHHPCRSGGRNV